MRYRTRSLRYFIAAGLLASGSQVVQAELALTESPGANAIRSVLGGPGLELGAVQVTKGTPGQYGLFSGGRDPSGTDPVLNVDNGLYMTTGNRHTILGPNNLSKSTHNTRQEYADPDLATISAKAIYDPVIIEFDIVPEGDRLNFLHVFGSEEYPEFVCSQFNDAFGLFVSGPGFNGTQNSALIPDTNYPITVNNVNSGQAGSEQDGTPCNLTQSIYFVDNGNGSGNTGTQLDGFTAPLTASIGNLQSGQTYRVKLALADTGDQAYDSSVFFKWLTSTSSTDVDLELSATASTLTPAQNGQLDLIYTVQNVSGLDTRLVAVDIDLPAGMSLISDDSQGMFEAGSGEWTVGDLPANSSRTLQLRVAVGSAYSYTLNGEILFSFNEDPDSTPFNREVKPNEDDTARLVLYPKANTAPEITNNGSASIAEVTFPENSAAIVANWDVSDVDGETEGNGLNWSISGGQDAGRFTLDQMGNLRFVTPPDFESPLDMGADNRYQVQAKVCDSQATCDIQTLTVVVTDVDENQAPTITNNGSAANAELTFPENSTAMVADMGAQDAEGETEGNGLVWSISGGQDAGLFKLDDLGNLSFLNAPDFENPADAGTDNRYQVQAKVCDSKAKCDVQTLSVVVTDVDENEPPVIINNNGSGDGLNFPENSTELVTNLKADDDGGTGSMTWTISGGDDQALFRLDDQNNLRFIVPPDFEKPEDANGDNRYKIEVKACDSDGLCATQTITVNVTDVNENEAPVITNNNSDATIELTFPENSTEIVADWEAEDANGDKEGSGLNWALIGGDDVALFKLDDNGNLRFLVPPDFEKPEDANGDNRYQVNARVCDSQIMCDEQKMTVVVTDVDENQPPTITNHNSDESATIDFVEESTEMVIDMDAQDDTDATEGDGLNWIISGGADSSLFTLSAKGKLWFEKAPDFEIPGDVGADNNYEVNVRICDASFECDVQALTIVVKNQDEDDDGDGVDNVTEIAVGTNPNEPDSDYDGVPDDVEIGDNPDKPLDTDEDGIINALDTDDDNDTIPTAEENYNGGTPEDDNTDSDSLPDYLDKDDDNDGLLTRHENYNGGTPKDDNTDGDDRPDYLDSDDDGDGKSTKSEGSDPNGDGVPDDAVDEDLDELVDYLDPEETPFVKVQARVMLQGPYKRGGIMRDDLRRLYFLPYEQPYSRLQDSFGYGSNGNTSPIFNYKGDETLSDAVYNVTGDDAIVDWVLLQVRDRTDRSKILASRAAVVQRDGDIIDAETGESELMIRGVDAGNHYLAVEHRNHLGVMSAVPLNLSKAVTFFDFADPDTPVFGGDNAREIGVNHAMLWAGDINGNNRIVLEGPGTDLAAMLGSILVAPNNVDSNANFHLPGYYASDVGLDGFTIYAGPNNDGNYLIGNVFNHVGNVDYDSNFIINGTLINGTLP